MANNIVGGAPNAIVAKSTVSFATAGITALNTEIIYRVGNPLQSYVPGRAINGISGFETGKGYYLVAKISMDLESIVVPPLDSLPTLATPTGFTATTISDTQINLAWSAVTNATGYILQRATNSGFTANLTTLVSGSNVLSYNDTGRTASTQYFYRLKAHDATATYNDSSYTTDDATTDASGGSFLTWVLGTDVTTDVNGVKLTGTGVVASGATSNETFLPGDKLQFSIDGQDGVSGDDAHERIIGLYSGGFTDWHNLTVGLHFYNSQAVYSVETGSSSFPTTRTTFSPTDIFQISYRSDGTAFDLKKSTDGGTTFTTFFTALVSPSGTYNCGVWLMELNAYFHNIKKV